MQNKICLQYETFVEPIEYKENISNTEIEELNYYRYDVFPKTGDDSFTEIIVNVNPVVFDIVKIFKFKELELFIESFVWNACEFRFDKLNIDPVLFVPWFLKWININDDFMYKQYQNFIHGIVINNSNDGQAIIFDLGTANINAMTELLEILSDFGIKTTRLISSYN